MSTQNTSTPLSMSTTHACHRGTQGFRCRTKLKLKFSGILPWFVRLTCTTDARDHVTVRGLHVTLSWTSFWTRRESFEPSTLFECASKKAHAQGLATGDIECV
eukprot:4139408-Amphidinium_carterae.1